MTRVDVSDVYLMTLYLSMSSQLTCLTHTSSQLTLSWVELDFASLILTVLYSSAHAPTDGYQPAFVAYARSDDGDGPLSTTSPHRPEPSAVVTASLARRPAGWRGAFCVGPELHASACPCILDLQPGASPSRSAAAEGRASGWCGPRDGGWRALSGSSHFGSLGACHRTLSAHRVGRFRPDK
jgi:hypothetical protein